jgi:tetratricopeptide (TPR) repeat protein
MNAREWSRAAWALALLFGSLPVVGRLVQGDWEFVTAAELACIFLMLGAYFHVRSRRYPPKPDPATLLDQANRLAAEGRLDRALALLTRTIRDSPRLWQAYQYRGELRLGLGQFALAEQDFAEAIRLAPDEPHLHLLLQQSAKKP